MSTTIRALACLAMLLAVGAAGAQNWPTKPVKMVVSTGPGLSADLVGRVLSDRLSKSLGQQFVVENIGGAGGIIGAQAVARAAPDGYTFLFTGGGTLITNIYAFKSLPYDPVRELTPVAFVTEPGGFIVSVNAELPPKSLAELISYAKARPGQLSYALDSSNIYGIIIGKLLNKAAGLDMVEILYKSTPQAIQDTVAGRTQVMISAIAPVEPFAKSGKMRVLAISSPKRNPSVPDLPAMNETLPGFQIDGGGFSVSAPAATPADIIQRFNRAIAGIGRDAEFGKQLLALGQFPAAGAPPEAWAEYLRSERERWAKIFQELGIKPQ
jgi:tripartite-type tricarboxylate transporter receptor subunit TctC